MKTSFTTPVSPSSRYSRNTAYKQKRERLIADYNQYVSALQERENPKAEFYNPLLSTQKTRENLSTRPISNAGSSQQSSVFSKRFMSQDKHSNDMLMMMSPVSVGRRNIHKTSIFTANSPHQMPLISPSNSKKCTSPIFPRTAQQIQNKRFIAHELPQRTDIPLAGRQQNHSPVFSIPKLSTTFFHHLSQIQMTDALRSPSPEVQKITNSKIGLSKYTQDYSEEMERVITQIETNLDSQRGATIEEKRQRANKSNCQELLQNVNQEIKTLNYRLNRIVGSEGSHKILHISKTQELEAVQDVMIYCKVDLKSQPGQQIVFKMNTRQDPSAGQQNKPSFISVFISTNVKEPSNETCQMKFDNKKQFIFNPRLIPNTIDPKTGLVQQKDTLYLTFLSTTSLYIQLTIMTLRDYKHQQNLLLNPHMSAQSQKLSKKKIPKDVDQEEIDLKLQAFFKKYEQEELAKAKKTDNFVSKNRLYQGFWRPEVQQEVIEINKREEKEKLERAIKSKEEQVEAERKKKYFYMHKWSLIRSKKQELLEEKLEERERRHRGKFYITLMQILKMSMKLLSNFHEKKVMIQRLLHNALCATRVKHRLSKYIKKCGPTYEIRQKKFIQNSIKLFCKGIQRPVIQRSKEIMVFFLESTALIFNIRSKIMEFHHKIQKIQLSNQCRLTAIRHRFLLFEEYWDHVIVEMQTALKSNKKQKQKANKYVIKLFQVGEKAKQKYFQTYLKYCKDQFLVRFLDWRQHKLTSQGKQPVKEWSQEIPKLFDSIKRDERHLFEEIDPIIEESTAAIGSPQLEKKGGPPKSILAQKKYKDILKKAQKNYSQLVVGIQKTTSSEDTQVSPGGDESREMTPLAPVIDAGPCPIFVFVPKKWQMIRMIGKAMHEE